MPVAEYQLLPPSVDSLTKKYELDTLHDVDTEIAHSNELDAASRRAKLLGICFGLSFAVNIILLSIFATNGWKIPVLLRKGEQWAIWRGAAPVYSPASEFITHKLKLSDRFTQASDYNGPRTKTRDHLWESLYLPYSPAAVPRWMAEPLLNYTERVQDDTERLGEPRYIIDLDVFHQLHCLDMIRRKLKGPLDGEVQHHSPKFIPIGLPGDPPYEHVDHCLNSLRESLMCNPDLTPIVWQWDETQQRTSPKIDVVHTCVDFRPIQEWAKKWKLPYPPNDTIRVVDDWVHSPPKLGT